MANFMQEGLPVWDICCDHGLLGEYALRTKRFPEVHFVDQVPNILQKTQRRLLRFSEARFHCVDATALAEPLNGNVVIAGVGGKKIIQILHSSQRRNLLRATRMILSPHKDRPLIAMLAQDPNWQNWELSESCQMEDKGQEHHIFVFTAKAATEFQLR